MRDYQKDLEVCEKATPEPWVWSGTGELVYVKADRTDYPVIGIEHYDGPQIAMTEENDEFITTARTAWPWYIRCCISLESQLQQAQAKVRDLERQKHNILEAHKLAEWQLGQVSDQLTAIYYMKNDQYWAWQPDFEDNYLESLTCPVLIPAAWLRELLEKKDIRLQQAHEREAAVLSAFNAWSDKPEWVNDEFDALCGAIEALSSPSQPSRYQEMVDLLEKAAEEIENCYGRETDLTKSMRNALSSPAQPSRYQAMENIVQLAKKVDLYEDFGSPGWCDACKEEGAETAGWDKAREELHDAITAYDKAGEGAGRDGNTGHRIPAHSQLLP